MILLVGCLIGLVLGLTGAGGSVFAVPLLLYLLHLPLSEAAGLSLGAVASSALLGAITRLRSGHIQWLPAVVYAVLGSLMAPLGQWLGRYIAEPILLIVFSILVLLIAWRMWQQAQQHPEQTAQLRASLDQTVTEQGAICRFNQGRAFRIGVRCAAGIGAGAILTGFLSGLFGVGGGFLIVPTLLFLTGIDIRQAVATSLVIIAVISLSGFISFVMQQDSSLPLALLGQLAGGGVLGMLAGLLFSRYLAGPLLQKTFAVLMLLMAAMTLFSQISR